MLFIQHDCSEVLPKRRATTKKLLRIMHLLTFLLTACCLHVSANSDAQVTYSAKNKPLEMIFQEVSKICGYTFFYSGEDIKDFKAVTVEAKNLSIDDFVLECLKELPLTFYIKRKTVVIKRKSAPEIKIINPSHSIKDPIEVSIRVSNEQGDPVAGVTIMVKGTQKMVATNADGMATLKNVDPEAILILTAVNIVPTETLVSGKSNLLIKVQGKTGKLDEVQVVAYGTNSQRFNTGNVISVKAEEIEKQPVNNPILALQGRVPGLMVVQQSGIAGSGLSIQLRGQNSINSSNDVLYVIDGVPVSANLNGRPITSTSENGVAGGSLGATPSALSYINPAEIESIDVLKDADATAIYGSRGANGVILITTKKGKMGSTKVDINVQKGWGEVANRVSLLNTQQYIEMRQEALQNDGINLNAPPYSNPLIKAIRLPDLAYWDKNKYTDWQKEIIGGASQYLNAQSSISGGNSLLQFIVGGSFKKETTVFPGNYSDNNGSIHFNISGNTLNRKLKVSLTGSYFTDNNRMPNNDLTLQIYTPPNAPNPFKADGSLNWQQIPELGGYSTFFRQPYSTLKESFNLRVNNLTGSGIISYQLFPFLLLQSNFSYNTLQSNSYSAIPLAAINPYIWSTSQRVARFGNSNTRTWLAEPQLIFKKNILNGELNITLGASAQRSTTLFQILTASGFGSDAIMQNLMAANSILPSYSSSEYKYAAAFGRLTYNIENKYLFSINGRRDASSRFGPGRQFAKFYSISSGWIFSEEKIIKSRLKAISYGKLRFSYGTTGNDQIGDYKYLELYQYYDLYQGNKSLNVSGVSNPYYSWETNNKMESGFELGLFKDRLLLNISYYRNRSSNQLANKFLPTYIGPSGSFLDNLKPVVLNYGWEFVLNTTNIKTKYFTWSSSFNTSINKNKLIKDFNGKDIENAKPLGYSLAYKFAGVDPQSGRYLFYDKNGNTTLTPNSEDRTQYYNTKFPKFFGGLQNTLVYKSFQLDFLLQFVKREGLKYIWYGVPGVIAYGNQPTSVLERWRKSGDLTNIQKYTTNQSFLLSANNASLESDLGFGDLSYARLKNASVSWQLPTRWKSKISMENVRIFLHAQNLITFTSYQGLDPESNGLSLPPLRVITVGFQLTF